MATGNIKATQRKCASCDKVTKFERNAMVMGCGDLVMTIVTLGAWLIIRYVMNGMTNPWRCTTCGGKG